MVPQLTGHGEGPVPEALESPPLEDGGGKEGWLRPPFRGQAEPLTCSSQASILDGSPSTAGKGPGSCSLHPRVTCLILPSPASSPRIQGTRWPEQAVFIWGHGNLQLPFPILLGQAQGWSPAAKQRCHRMVLTWLVRIPEPGTWLRSPEKLIAVTMETPLLPLRSWDQVRQGGIQETPLPT